MISVSHAPRIRRSLNYAALALALLWTLLPVWWAFALSIKRPPDFFSARILPFVQFQPTLDNWREEWRALGDPAGLGHGLTNSLLVATVTAALSLALGLPAAFGLALPHGARRPIWPLVVLFLLPRILPPVVTAIPFATAMQWLGLSDTVLALVVADTTFALPLVVLILLTAVAELPAELFDAAQIDGCGMIRALYLIVAPMLAPALLSTAALCFAQSWNEFLYALMNVQQRVQTAPLAIAALLNKDGIEFEYVGSHLLMVMLPPLLLAIASRRTLVRGLSLGALDDLAAKAR
jgi:multiple sugar transport system permease protein